MDTETQCSRSAVHCLSTELFCSRFGIEETACRPLIFLLRLVTEMTDLMALRAIAALLALGEREEFKRFVICSTIGRQNKHL